MDAAVTHSSIRQKGAVNKYYHNSVTNASPEELILKLYDIGIVSMRQKNMKRAEAVLVELIASLNFEYHEQANGLFRLYQYCQDCIFREEYQSAEQIIQELRDTWAEAFNLV